MFCRNCGKEIDDKAAVCVNCGVPPKSEKKFCQNCGQATEVNQAMCTKCGVTLVATGDEKSRITAGLLALLLGGFGAHKFYLGYFTQGIIVLVAVWLGLLLIGIPTIIMGVIVFIEGIIYLTKSDYDFQQTYVINKKGWF